MADPTADDVAAWIKSGSFDDNDGVMKIFDAVKFKFQTGDIALGWKVDIGGLSVTEDSLTLGEWEDLEALTRQPWTTMKPAAWAKWVRALLTVVYQSREGLSAEDAAVKARGWNAVQIAEAITEEQRNRPPKGSAT